jgi:hypothetical protein
MANVRSTDNDAKIMVQMARGRRTRYVQTIPIIVAQDRAAIDTDSHYLADAIKGDTAGSAVTKGIFAAPCDGKVVRIWINASVYPTMASGAASVKVSKAVIGTTDVDLCSVISVGKTTPPNTAETAIDGTLSTTAGALNIITGQLVYATIDVANQNVSTISQNLVLNVEWVPTDSPQ